VDDWYPPLEERAPGQVVLFNGMPPKEMTVLQVGDRVVGASGGVKVTLKVLDPRHADLRRAGGARS